MLREVGLFDISALDVVEPMAYLDFMGLVAGSRLVLTDSGGIQEETTVLGVPCLTLRDNTERPVTIDWGSNQLVGRDRAAVVAAARRVMAQDGGTATNRVPPLWDGRSGERIAQIIDVWLHRDR